MIVASERQGASSESAAVISSNLVKHVSPLDVTSIAPSIAFSLARPLGPILCQNVRSQLFVLCAAPVPSSGEAIIAAQCTAHSYSRGC